MRALESLRDSDDLGVPRYLAWGKDTIFFRVTTVLHYLEHYLDHGPYLEHYLDHGPYLEHYLDHGLLCRRLR
jgi:hypothetical protein